MATKPLKLNQIDCVVLAVFELGGAQQRVRTEDVAVRANAIGNGVFAWVHYPDQINLELVRVKLSDAKKPQCGKLVAGTGNSGWSLTPAGLARAQELQHRPGLRRPVAGTSEGTPRRVGRRTALERARLLQSDAWTRWTKGNHTVDSRTALALLRLDRYSNGHERAEKAARLLSLFSEDPILAAFVAAIVKSVPPAEDINR